MNPFTEDPELTVGACGERRILKMIREWLGATTPPPPYGIGDDCAVFEAVHGSAPDIAGQNMANPTALIRSAELMLRHLGERAAAESIRLALLDMYRDGTHLTADMGGNAGTREFTEHLSGRVSERSQEGLLS